MIFFPLINPTNFIARFLVKAIVSRLAVPAAIALPSVFNSFLSLTTMLIPSIGLFRTIRIINILRTVLNTTPLRGVGREPEVVVRRVVALITALNLNHTAME